MQSPRTLGIFALCAVILAAISFAAVDVTIAGSCSGAGTCVDELPPVAAVCGVIGTLALLASILPAINWFVDAVHHSQHDADIEPMRMAIVRPAFEDDDL